MAGRRYRYCNFREYEGEAFARYLEKMAAKGWYIDRSMLNNIWSFRKGEPSKRRYNVVLMPGSSRFDIEENEGSGQFRELCSQAGWNLEYGGILWQIFYTQEEDVLPVESDPETKLDLIRDIMMAPWRLVLDFLIVCCLLAPAISVIWKTGIDSLSILQAAGCGLLAVWAIYRAVSRFSMIKWYRKARQSVERGDGIPSGDVKQAMFRSGLELVFSIIIILAAFQIRPLLITLIWIEMLESACIEVFRYRRDNEGAAGGEKARVIIILVIIILIGVIFFPLDYITRITPDWIELGKQNPVIIEETID